MAALRMAAWRDGGQQALSDLGKRLSQSFTVHCHDGIDQLVVSLPVKQAVPFFKRPQVVEVSSALPCPFAAILAHLCRAMSTGRRGGLVWRLIGDQRHGRCTSPNFSRHERFVRQSAQHSGRRAPGGGA